MTEESVIGVWFSLSWPYANILW